MKHLLFFIVFFTAYNSSFAQSVEKEIASYTLNLDNGDYSKLDNIIKDKRIVILGEGFHQAGTTFRYKIEMIKYLMQKHGFNTIGLEGIELFGGMVYSKMKGTTLEESGYATTNECKELVDLITSNKLKYFGFDMPDYLTMYALKHFPLTKELDFNIIKRHYYLKNYDRQTLLNNGIDTTSFTLNDEKKYVDELNRIRYIVEKEIADKYTKNNIPAEYSALLQCVKTLKADYRGTAYRKGPFKENFSDMETTEINQRDAQMADNIIWYMDQHPDSKIIIWTASFHGARNISQVTHPDSSIFYPRYKLMGEYLSEKYGNLLYSIAFTSSDGDIVPVPEKSLERQIANRGIITGFLDFTPLRNKDEFFLKTFHTGILKPKDGYWLNVFDGIFFHKENRFSTLRPPTQ